MQVRQYIDKQIFPLYDALEKRLSDTAIRWVQLPLAVIEITCVTPIIIIGRIARTLFLAISEASAGHFANGLKTLFSALIIEPAKAPFILISSTYSHLQRAYRVIKQPILFRKRMRSNRFFRNLIQDVKSSPQTIDSLLNAHTEALMKRAFPTIKQKFTFD